MDPNDVPGGSSSQAAAKGLPPRPAVAGASASKSEWLSKVWSCKNRSFNLASHDEARASLWLKLCRVEWEDIIALPLFIERQQPYLDLQGRWGAGAAAARSDDDDDDEVPSAVDCEATRLMNRLVMPEDLVKLLADAGFNAYKCCDPDLAPEQKRTGQQRPEKRGSSAAAASGAKRVKTESEAEEETSGAACAATTGPSPSPCGPERNTTATPSTNNDNNTNPSTSTHAGKQPEPAAPHQKQKEPTTPAKSTSSAPTKPPTTDDDVVLPSTILDFNAALQNAISIKTGEISAVVAAQLYQHDEERRRRDAALQRALDTVRQCADCVRAAAKEEELAREALRAAVEQDDKARRNLKVSLELLDRSLAEAGEQLLGKP